ncbi:MAG: 50S ribosomal protein L13 [Bacteroidetes bacterium]|nr:50S ribosomal protein L13 [Bacteroidota bacterium]
MLKEKTTKYFKETDIIKKWYLVDASGKTVGRFASKVAHLLRGKHKPTFTPNVDCGDYVVIINADKIKFTGKRTEQKKYFRNTGYPGGAIFEKFTELIKDHPERVLEYAVHGMIPKNRLGKEIIKKLKVYAGSEHPHAPQTPESIKL